MANKIIDLKEELHRLQFEIHLLQKVDCSKEESKKFKELLKQGQALPKGVYRHVTEMGEELDQFYTIYKPEELSSEERMEYILLQQLQHIRIIKNCILFFTILTAISLAISLVISFFASL